MVQDTRQVAPSKWILATKIIAATLAALLLVWDFVVANNPWRADTVSELTIWASLRSLTLPMALGIVAGHLTWPAKERNPVVVVVSMLGSLLVVVLTLDVLTWVGVIDWAFLSFLRSWPPITFLTSYVLGRLVWPQARQ